MKSKQVFDDAKTYLVKDWDHAPVRMEKIDNLTWDLNLYPRREIDRKIAENYARALKVGSVFPNVKVGIFNGEKVIVDGAHRVKSRMLLKTDYVDCAELPFESEAELFAEAVRLNSSHGKSFSDDDLKANIRRLQKYKFSVKEIVALVHVPVAEVYRESAAPIVTLTSPCGKKFMVDTKGKLRQGLSGRELVDLKRALMLFCNLSESGRFPLDDPVIKELVERSRLDFARLRFNA